jgi:putative transcriptional regulator
MARVEPSRRTDLVNERVTIQGQSEVMDELLADYSSGSLPRPLHVLMASHLALSHKNRAYVGALEMSLAGEMADVVPGSTIRNRDDRINAIFSDVAPAPAVGPVEGDILPSALAQYIGKPLSDVRWKSKLPGLKEAHIETADGFETSLLWVKAGRSMPAHTHDGSELTLVLSGTFSDMLGHYQRGDVAVADSNIDHRPVIGSDADCICFVVTDAPLRLTGPFGRIFSRLMGHSAT